MANAATLADLRTAALRRCDRESSSFFGRWEVNGYVNTGGSLLHDVLVTRYRDFYKSSTSISAVAGTEAYALPTDFYKGLGRPWWTSGGIRFPLDPFMLDELTDDQVDLVATMAEGERLRYRIVGTQLVLAPKPTGAGTIEWWYVPQYVPLVDPFQEDGTTVNGSYVSGQDVINVQVVNGWEEAVIAAACVLLLQKEDRPWRDMLAYRDAELARIGAVAQTRDSAKPQRVRDVYGNGRSRRGRR